MKPLRVLHDLHEGAIRAAGTTLESQWLLRKHLQDSLVQLLPEDQNLMILGDLFDTNSVPIIEVLLTYTALLNWSKANPNCTLYMVPGNHDASKTSNVLSSFQFLCALLVEALADKVVVIDSPKMTDYGYVIPHMPNQEQFDLELERVPDCQYLFVHCNYDNHFATQSDQSLNLSEKQAADSKAKKIVFAHEHHGRNFGKILVPGNQVASSVSDWLSPQNKRFITVELHENDEDLTHHFTECAVRSDEYAEVQWDDLTTTDAKFVRVVGTASAEQSADVLNAVNRFRKQSTAFVVANAVAIATEGLVVNFEETLESVQGFSVMEALKKILTPAEVAILENLDAD